MASQEDAKLARIGRQPGRDTSEHNHTFSAPAGIAKRLTGCSSADGCGLLSFVHRGLLETGTRRWTAALALLPADLFLYHAEGCTLRLELAMPALPRRVVQMAVSAGNLAAEAT